MYQDRRRRLEHPPRDKRNTVLPAVCLTVFDVREVVGILLGGRAAGQAKNHGKRHIPVGHRPNENKISRRRVLQQLR